MNLHSKNNLNIFKKTLVIPLSHIAIVTFFYNNKKILLTALLLDDDLFITDSEEKAKLFY